MIVVADTSPFIGLLRIGQVHILPGLFGSVVVPPEVIQELSDGRRDAQIRVFASALPSWLLVQRPIRVELIEGLDACEQAAIGLAMELKADLLLIDEKLGREAAILRNL